MSSTAANRTAIALALVSAASWLQPACAARPEPQTAVVARLYKDFAWQAFTSQPALFGADLAHQDKAVLQRYLTPALADLLVRDAACQRRVRGICKLDFDMLFDSQDPRVMDLEVRQPAPGKVAVVFKDPVNQEETRIEFHLVQAGGQWRIGDIVYGGKRRLSLKNALSR